MTTISKEARVMDTPADSLVRLSVKLSREVAEALKALSDAHGTTITEEVRRAISLWKFLDAEKENGATVLLEKDGRYRQLVLDVLTGK